MFSLVEEHFRQDHRTVSSSRSGLCGAPNAGHEVTMGLEIIGSGFGRTGTMSLKGALEQLAFGPCHHMEELLVHPKQVHDWQEIVAGRRMNWEEVFAGYRS